MKDHTAEGMGKVQPHRIDLIGHKEVSVSSYHDAMQR